MTDLTLGHFESLSKQELSRRLKQEELEMHGSRFAPLAAPPVRPLCNTVAPPDFLRSAHPRVLAEKVFPQLRLTSRHQLHRSSP